MARQRNFPIKASTQSRSLSRPTVRESRFI
jgi:hypothetical protein